MSRWIDARTREYEARMMTMGAQLEQVKATSEATARELAAQQQRYQKLESETTMMITQLQQKERDNIHQLTELKSLYSIS